MGANAHGIGRASQVLKKKGSMGLSMFQGTILALIPLAFNKVEIWDTLVTMVS